jgi:hypothetical protein
LAGQVVGEGGEYGISKGFLKAGDVRRQFGSVVLPDDGFGNGDVFSECAIPVHTQDLGLRTHVGLTGAALEAVPAGDVAFGGYIVTYLDLLDEFSDGDHSAGEFMTDREGWMNSMAAPFIPFPDVEIGSAYACGFHLDEYVVRTRNRYRDIFDDETRTRFRFPDCLHFSGHAASAILERTRRFRGGGCGTTYKKSPG